MQLRSASIKRGEVEIEDTLLSDAIDDPVFSPAVVGRPVTVDRRGVHNGSKDA